VKALTVRQPWAYAIARGAKRVENRTRSTSHRGLLAIHAGNGWAAEGARDERVLRLLARHMTFEQRQAGVVVAADHPGRILFGRVLATVELVDCHRAEDCCAPWGDTVPSGSGRPVWHWVLSGARPLPTPVPPASGHLHLWDVELEPLESLLALATALRAGGCDRALAEPLAQSLVHAAYSQAPRPETLQLARFLRREYFAAAG
jgi:hypothetical protein